MTLEYFDPEVHQFLEREGKGDPPVVDLRLDRNYLSSAVLEALGSNLADLYVEGFPSMRFAGGPEAADELEYLCIERLKRLFKAEEAVIQPTSPNLAVAAALEGLLKPGDTVLAPVPGQGASLVFGHGATLWADRFRFVRYGLDPQSRAFNPEEITSLAESCSPAMIAVCVAPYPRSQDMVFWRSLADRTHAVLLVDLEGAAGLVPGGVIPPPLEDADVVTGMTNGLLRGPRGGFILSKKKWGDRIRNGLFPFLLGGASVNVMAAKAVALKEALSREFREYVGKCLSNASALARALEDHGLEVWTHGTDFHYLLLDVRGLGFSGLEGERRLARAGIAVRRVQMPLGDGCSHQGDGLILSTQAVTLRGMEIPDIVDCAGMIYRALT